MHRKKPSPCRSKSWAQGAHSKGKAMSEGQCPSQIKQNFSAQPSSKGWGDRETSMTPPPRDLWELCTPLRTLRHARLVVFFGQAPPPLKIPIIYLISQAI